MTSVTTRGGAGHESVESGAGGGVGPHNAAMARRIEPGLLRIFRFFVGIRLGFLVLQALAQNDRAANDLIAVPGPGIFVYSLLMAYLLIPAVQRWMGRRFLSVGLLVATVSAIFENGLNVAVRLERGYTPNRAVEDWWVLFFVLFVPLILIAWQYRFRAVLIFAVGTTVLDAVFLSPLLQDSSAEASIAGGLLLARGAIYAFVGYVIGKLIGAQRSHQQDLAHAAMTREQLATSNERARLARELHDTLAHTLSAVAVQLEGARSLWDDDADRAKAMVDQSLASTRTGLTEARRAIQALRASPLEELGLSGALRQLGAEAAETHAIAVDVAGVEDVGTVRPEVEHAVYRIAEESLTNAMRHAAPSVVEVTLSRRWSRIRMEVSDDGAGFDPDVATPDGHQGIVGMRERAELVGGELRLESGSGSGTTVVFEAAP